MSVWTYERMKALLDQYAPDPETLDARGRKWKRIIDAASELFAEQGYRKTSVDEIARHAGISKATFYQYFKTKGEVLWYAIGYEKKEYFAEIKPIFDKGIPAMERLKLYLRIVLQLTQKMPITSKLMRGSRDLMHAVSELPRDEMKKLEPIRYDFLGEFIREAAAPRELSDDEVRERVQVLVALNLMATQVDDPNVRGEMTVGRFAYVFADMVIDGLLPASLARASKKEGGES